MPGSSSPRCAGRIVARLGPIARLLLAPLRGSHRRQAGPYCPAPPRPAARVASSPGWALLPGSSSPRCAGRIVARLGPIARLLLAPLRGSHRRQAGPYCPAPPRPAARVASSPGWALLPGSSSPRCAGRIVARLGPIARLLLAPLRGSHRRQAGPYCPAPPRPAARVASSPGWALLPGSSSPRCAGRIVARLGPIARLLLAPLRGSHRRQAGPYCPAPPRPAARVASSPGWALLPGSSSPRCAGRIVARLGPIARLLLAPLRGSHRRQAGPYCPAPPRPAARVASSPGWALLPGSSSPRCAGRIVARLGPIARLLLAPLRGPHRRQAGPYCPAPPRPAARAASSPGWALLPGSSSPRCAGRIVARLGPIARLLLAPLRGPHRRQAGPYCPAPPRPAARAASSPGWALLPGSSSPRCAGRIVARLGPIARLLLAPLRGPHRRQAGPYCPAPPRPAARAASSPGWALLPGSSSPRCAGRIVARLTAQLISVIGV